MVGVTLFIVKIIGFLYRIPLTNLIGDKGNAIYSASFNIYLLFVLISVSGLPIAISRLVSIEISKGNYFTAHRIFRISMVLAIFVGLTSTSILYFGADKLENLLTGVQGSKYGIKVLAPTVFFVSVMGVFRGYFQGMKNFLPTSLSQTVEQLVNGIGSIGVAYILISTNKSVLSEEVVGAMGGTTGTLLGAISGFIVLIYLYSKSKKSIRIKINNSLKNKKEQYISTKVLLLNILNTTVPIILGTVVFSVGNIIDNKIIMTRLTEVGYSQIEAMIMYGQYAVKYLVIINLPISIASAFAIVSIPVISNIVEFRKLNDKINSIFRLSMVFSIPSAIGIFVLGDDIIKLLFNESGGGALLQTGAISIIFMTQTNVYTAILQGIGKEKIPVKIGAITLLVKVPILYYLIGVINIYGGSISMVLASLIASTLLYLYLEWQEKIKLDVLGGIVKPMISSILMGLIIIGLKEKILELTKNNFITIIISVSVGIIVYFACLILIKGLNENDVEMLPKGTYINNKLKIK